MFKFIRRLLYGLAIISGLAGLFVSALPLMEFVRDRLKDDGSRDYYEATYQNASNLHGPEIIFLLSLILLVCVCISLGLEKGIAPASSTKLATSEKTAEPSGTETPKNSPPAESATPPPESSDEKLTRLLNHEKN